MDNRSKKQEHKKNKEIKSILIEEKIAKSSIEADFDINLTEGTEAFYSERYGWTLRKIK